MNRQQVEGTRRPLMSILNRSSANFKKIAHTSQCVQTDYNKRLLNHSALESRDIETKT